MAVLSFRHITHLKIIAIFWREKVKRIQIEYTFALKTLSAIHSTPFLTFANCFANINLHSSFMEYILKDRQHVSSWAHKRVGSVVLASLKPTFNMQWNPFLRLPYLTTLCEVIKHTKRIFEPFSKYINFYLRLRVELRMNAMYLVVLCVFTLNISTTFIYGQQRRSSHSCYSMIKLKWVWVYLQYFQEAVSCSKSHFHFPLIDKFMTSSQFATAVQMICW